MSFKSNLEAIVIFQVVNSNLVSDKGTEIRKANYEKGRQWLKSATGEEILSWRQAVIQHEKQLSNS